MANNENRDKLPIKLKSERFFITGSEKKDDTILTSSFQLASASFAEKKYLTDDYLTWTEGAIIYQLQQMQDDMTLIHKEVSQSVYETSISEFASIGSASFGLISSSLTPDKDNKYDLGGSGKEWKDLFIDGTANIDRLDVGAIGTNLIPVTPAKKGSGQDLGSPKARWSRIWLASHIDVSGSELVISSPSASAAGNDFNVIVSGSIVPGDTDSGSLGSIDAPFKDLYIQSSSIYLADMSTHNFGSGNKKWNQMSKAEKLQRSTIFQKDDVDKLKRGESLNDSGIISASGDLFVSGSTKLVGSTEIHGVTTISGLTDIRGGFKINGNAISDDELRSLEGLTSTTAELNTLDGIGTTKVHTQLAAKENTLTFGKSSGNALKSEEALTTNDVLLMGSSDVKGRTYSELKGDLSLVKGDVGLGNVDNTTDANKPVSTATTTELNKKATINAVGGNLTPDGDNTRDLGAVGKEWKNLYVDGTANIDTLSADVIKSNLIPAVPAKKGQGQTIGSPKARWGAIYLASSIDVSGSSLVISSPSASAAGDDFNVIVSGSIVPGDTESGSLGSIDAPFKDLYIQSSSIYLADMSTHNFGQGNKSWRQMSKSEKLARSTVFQKDDVDKLKRGESLSDSGIISASGDLFVSGSTKLIGSTEIRGNTSIIGDTDIRGGFKINGNAISEDEMRSLAGLEASTEELNKLKGFTGNKDDLNYAKALKATGVTTAELNLLSGITHVKDEDNMSSNSATSLATQQSIKKYVADQQNQGPKGDKGDTGDTGSAGAKGDKGDTGSAGAKGDKGDTGSAGAKGDKGDTGSAGSDGSDGSAGAKGDKGDTGSAGAKGDKGDTGSAGAKGDKGDTGSAGAKGDKGDTGSAGSDGSDGSDGSAGAKGDKGDTGSTGSAGAKGDKGDTGSAGADGADGADGTTPTVETSLINGSTNVVTNNAVFDGLALKLNLSGGTMSGALTPRVLAITGSPNKGAADMRAANVLQVVSKQAVTLITMKPAANGQEVTIVNLGTGAITITHANRPTADGFTIYGGKNLSIATAQAYKFIYSQTVRSWIVIQ